MVKLNSKFTDAYLKQFYSNILSHYNKLSQKEDPLKVYDELFLATQFALEDPIGHLYNLLPEEKIKAYVALNVIYTALPLFVNLPDESKQTIKPIQPKYDKNRFLLVTHYYEFQPSFLDEWVVLNSLLHRCTYQQASERLVVVHSHKSEEDKNNPFIRGLIIFLVIILAAAAAVFIFITLYYMLNQLLDSVERLLYNEGWHKAALMMASSLVLGSLASWLTIAVFSSPLIALALAIGLNPIGVIIVGAIGLSVLGAGLACFITDLLYEHFSIKLNSEAIDPEDPLRFRLTTEDEVHLTRQGIDPMSVKCAILALRSEISQVQNGMHQVPFFLHRQWGEGKKVHHLLQQVRGLRHGSITEVQVGQMMFQCQMDKIAHLPLPSAPLISDELHVNHLSEDVVTAFGNR